MHDLTSTLSTGQDAVAERERRKRVESAAMQHVMAQIRQVAPTPATVLLLGETGTGKEVMARTIHELSPRRQRRMVAVSCAAIPAALIESELFGREKGAYTDAVSRQIGRFEAAQQSTLFLDEIGDLPMAIQVKLLRVLEERVVERLGSAQRVKVDVRIIAATNRNLDEAVRDKTFREDLYYRLNVFPVVVPPLRERVEDITALAWAFVDEFAQSFGKTIESISEESLLQLQRYSWPGNVRELRNVIERAVILATGRHLVVAVPPHDDPRAPERDAIRRRAHEVWPAGRGGVVIDSGLFVGTLRHRRFRPIAHPVHLSAVHGAARPRSLAVAPLRRELRTHYLLKNGARRILFNEPWSKLACFGVHSRPVSLQRDRQNASRQRTHEP